LCEALNSKPSTAKGTKKELDRKTGLVKGNFQMTSLIKLVLEIRAK
jgi:hypothetical protein